MSIKKLPSVLESKNINLIGEYLRDLLFIESDQAQGLIGCYTTFKVSDQAKAFSKEQIKQKISLIFYGQELDQADEETKTSVGYDAQDSGGYLLEYEDVLVEAVWFWDGDGSLAFKIFDQDKKLILSIINNDCKKDYTWKRSHNLFESYIPLNNFLGNEIFR